MGVEQSDLKFKTSSHSVGGKISLGGAKTNDDISTTKDMFFDRVEGEEHEDGVYKDYRIFYIVNENSDGDDALNVKVRFEENFDSTDGSEDSGPGNLKLGKKENAGVVAGQLTSETTAPTGVSYVTGENKANALDLGTIPGNGGFRAVYIERTIPQNAGAKNTADNRMRVSVSTGE